jgi:D-3-phosphoglycerate dehydrogenase
MQTKYRVLNMADIAACPQLFDSLSDVAEVVTLPADQDVLRGQIADYDAYFSSLYVRADRSVLERAQRLRAIATPTTGLDHFDLAYAKERGIEILSLKNDIAFLESVTATAEMAWALLLAVARRLPWSFDAAKNGHWARDGFRGHQLSGKTLGVLGYGRLGKMVAEYGQAFRMRVLACDTKDIQPAPGIEMVDFQTLLRESDVLSIHIHLTPENRGLIGARELASMKPDAILLNTSRGAIIDEQALVSALREGKLGGAGLDVIDGEWNEELSTHPLIKHANEHQNLVISPHTGGITFESQAMALTFTANKLKAFLENLTR